MLNMAVMKTGSSEKKGKRRKKIWKPHATKEKVEKRGPLKLIYVYNGIREKCSPY